MSKVEGNLKLLQLVYAGVLADAAAQFAAEGVLEKVTERKKAEQERTGVIMARQMGITCPEEVFTRLAEVFNCANWTIEPRPEGFCVQTNTCMLYALAKKMNSPSPCRLYCLNPMEGMVKGLSPDCGFKVEETLWNGQSCRVIVTKES